MYKENWKAVFLCLCLFMYAGKANLRLLLNGSDHAVIHEVQSPSPVQTPSSGASSQGTLTCPQSPRSEAFHWPDVQELRSKYAESSRSKITRSCTVPNGMLESCTNRCNSCSHKYSSSSDLHKDLTDCPNEQSETFYTEKSPLVEDCPTQQTQPLLNPLLCRWSSLDHMLGSLPLSEVQNLQEPARTCFAVKDGDSILQEGPDSTAKSAVLTSGKTSESNLVKSLREKFQSLGTSLWTCTFF